MNDHQKLSELLPLAVSGTLDAERLRQLEQHAATCPECSAEMERWRQLTFLLRRLPTPQPSPLVVERARARAAARLAVESERRTSHMAVAFSVLFAWTLTLAGWAVFRLMTGGIAASVELVSRGTWTWLIGYTAVGWLTAGVVAVIIATRYRPARRVA